MNNKDCTIYFGAKFTIEWYYDKDGKSVANEFFMEARLLLQMGLRKKLENYLRMKKN